MALVYDPDYITQVVDIGVGEIDETLEGVDEAFGKGAVGMKNPSAQDIASFFFHQNVLYPPQLFQYPDGHVVMGSAWILHLEFCENGREWTDRFTAFVKRNGGM